MKLPKLNAIQKARMSMAMNSKKPKLNAGFDSLPKEVQTKILKKKKPKMAMKKPMMAMKKPMLTKKAKAKKMVMNEIGATKKEAGKIVRAEASRIYSTSR